MRLCRTNVSPHLPSTQPPPPPPHPKNNHTVNRRQCCETFQASCNVPSILQRANFLATSQQLLNVPSLTSYKRKFGAYSVKTGSKSDWKKFRAEHQERVTSCMCLCRTNVSPHLPPTPPLPTPRPKNNPTVIRRQCGETLQASFHVPSILQRANYLATSQHLLNAQSVTSYKRKFGAWRQDRLKKWLDLHVPVLDKSFPPPPPPPLSPPPPHPKNNHTVIRRQCCETFQASCNVPNILQRANYLATSQQLPNVPSLTSYKRKFGA